MKMLPTRERPAQARLVVPTLGTLGREVPPVDGRGSVTDDTWPLHLGCVRRDQYLSDRRLNEVERELRILAQLARPVVGSEYVEDPDTTQAALRGASGLGQSLPDHGSGAAGSAAPNRRSGRVRARFERVTGARIMLREVAP